ncbi:MAG: hypothetical protein JW716_02665 [Candidatus Aenigmarchaeota archaeon]|nr:hypothetical protein [Candidatus Aenigmarchaeota archaeon]
MKNLYNYIFTFLAVFSAYLIICLPFAFAGEISNYVNLKTGYEKTISFSPIATTLEISSSDDFEPLKCDGEKYERFTVFVDNYAYTDSYDIEAITGTIVVGNQLFDVSDILTCSPTKNLISNSQIECSLDVESFINDKLMTCPPPQPAMVFTLSVTIKSSRGPQTLSLMKESAIISTETDTSMHIQSFGISEVNCLLGSDLEALITVYHAETFGNDIDWGFVVNGTKKYGEESIDCYLVTEGDITTGSKDNIYSCILRVPSLAFEECTEGLNFPITITAGNEDFKINDTFQAITIKEELNLKLQVSSIGSVSCQIVSDISGGDGDCVPDSPQREMSVRLTGNRISKVKTFAYKYRIDEENFTQMSCKQNSVTDSEQTFICNIFLPRMNLTENPPDSESFSGSSKINISFQTQYINTFGTVSSAITVSYTGNYRDASTSTLEELEKKKEELKEYEKYVDYINKALDMITTMKCCCGMIADFKDLLKKGNTKNDLLKFARDILPIPQDLKFGKFFEALDSIFQLIGQYGPAVGNCVLKVMEKGYTENINALNDFENNPDFEASFEPLKEDYSFGEVVKDPEFLKCVATELASAGACGCAGVFNNPTPWQLAKCGTCLALIALAITGTLPAICSSLTASSIVPPVGIWGWLQTMLLFASALLTLLIFFVNQEILELTSIYTNARMQAMMEQQMSMTSYASAYQDFINDLATGNAAAIGMSSLFPPKPEAYIAFNDSSGNLLNIGDTICGDEMITISYNFEKFQNLTGFVNVVEIFNADRGGVVNRMEFGQSYGIFQQPADLLLKIEDPTSSCDGLYEFIFNYGSAQNIYRLNYQEVC